MDKQMKPNKNVGEKSNEMQPMDQGLNLVAQTFNNATGVDKGNDGKNNPNQQS
ncbi:hypothetical protein SM124_06045 [Bacillus sp. 31A1R]|uniref:Uncharacterized protein n=1 Tax=Robertmurraya mangrovi TaxID=3098077 RepID=A0ABU5IVX2_9BACI|nr:hypothetical protein [Bacillus sp. 31A1R]MDZ5471304.1 hypothetical protein [Bacillus sp. 31A1R]